MPHNFEILAKTKKKTKKKKENKNLWNLFDSEINVKKPIECIFSKEEESTKDCNSCHNCSFPLAYNSDGFIICTNKQCAIINTNIVDRTAEWRYYGADDNSSSDPTRCGMPINPLLKESSFGCKIIVSSTSNYEMRKIRRYTEWQSMPYHEKSLYDEISRIALMAGNAGIPKLIIDDAMRYHKKISEQKTFRGFNRDGIIAASIYISCRINNNPRTAKEIANIFNLDTSSATKGCKNAVSIINTIENTFENNDKTTFCKLKPIDFIERYCSPLNINFELTKLCKFIAMKIEKNNLIPQNTPHSISAGIIYFISQLCNLNITKKDIHFVTNISEVTINKCYKEIEKKQQQLIPPSLYKKYIS